MSYELFQVDEIPLLSQSVEHYLGSFVFPLLEETRAPVASSIEVINSAPFAEVLAVSQAKPYAALSYQIKVDLEKQAHRPWQRALQNFAWRYSCCFRFKT